MILENIGKSHEENINKLITEFKDSKYTKEDIIETYNSISKDFEKVCSVEASRKMIPTFAYRETKKTLQNGAELG